MLMEARANTSAVAKTASEQMMQMHMGQACQNLSCPCLSGLGVLSLLLQ